MKKIQLVLKAGFLLLLPIVLQAQPPDVKINPAKALVKGKIVDSDSQLPLEFATITLFNQKDSSVATGVITDETGNFLLETNFGSYFARFEFLSYKMKIVENISLSRNEPMVDLGIIALESGSKMLAEVEVRAEKSQMQLSLDKRVFNVGKDLANAGGTAADVLNNVPSVTVDVEGNVELRGSGGVRILVDGKPSGLVGISNSDGLRQIPANLIDRVEVITNPSARYEAEGMSGIINIVLKKDRSQGLNGSFDLTLGTPDEYGAAVNLNYRHDRFNWFANYGLRYREGPGTGSQYQEYLQNGTIFITDQDSDRSRGSLSNSIRLGADYFFSPKSILTSAFNFRYSDDDNFSKITYRDYLNSLNNPLSITYRTDDETEAEPNLEYALTYKKLFQRNGHEFTADFRYQDNTEKESSNFIEETFATDGLTKIAPDLHQRSVNNEKQKNVIFQTDYLQPFSKEGKFEVGLRAGLRDIENDFKVEQEYGENEWIRLPGLSNNFIYQEDIYAVYASLGNKFNKFNLQAGLRSEYSDIYTALGDTINDRQYANLFPSLFLGYELSEKNSLQVSYSRRIRRPGHWELNPFFTYSDARNFWSGNPNLGPEFTDSYDLGYLRYFEKGSLTSSVFYRHTKDVVERIRTQLSDTTSFTQPVNLATRDDYGVEFTFTYDPFKIWRLNGNANFFRSVTAGEYEGQLFDADAYTWFGRLSSRLTILKKVDVQVNFNYRAPRNTPQGKEKSLWHVDPAASMDVFKGNGTLTLSVRDLFNTRKRRFITEGDNFYTEGEHQWRARQTTLTFSYRLNQKKQRNGREGRNGGDFDEDF
jgi:outer membrane receptor protein involved in Fe transport